jgi:hypothetical protein
LTISKVDQAAALRSALHLNVEVSGDEFHLVNAHSLQNEGRVISRPANIFHFDPAREFGVGISHEAQRHVDEFLGALEHTNHMCVVPLCASTPLSDRTAQGARVAACFQRKTKAQKL